MVRVLGLGFGVSLGLLGLEEVRVQGVKIVGLSPRHTVPCNT